MGFTVLYVVLGVALAFVLVSLGAMLYRRRFPESEDAAHRVSPYVPIKLEEGDPAILPLLDELNELRETLAAQYGEYTAYNDSRYREFTKRLGIAVAVLAAGLVVSLTLVVIANNRTHEVAEANSATLRESQAGRGQVTRVLCEVDNDQNATLRGLIVGGAKGSKPFDKVYRQFGLPPYKERLRQARAAARSLPVIDCEALVAKARQHSDQGPVFVQP